MFDNYGHTINVIDEKGYVTYYFYENIFDDIAGIPNWNLNNKVIGTTSTEYIGKQNNDALIGYQNPRPNLIQNPEFDNGTENWENYSNFS